MNTPTPDEVQALVAEARSENAERPSWAICLDLADALEALAPAPANEDERETLARLINAEVPDLGCDAAFADDDPCFKHRAVYYWLADAILAAGWRRPPSREEIARAIRAAQNRSEDREGGQSRADWYAAAVLSLWGGR